MNTLVIDVEGARYRLTMEHVGRQIEATAQRTKEPVTGISTLTVDELAAVLETIESLSSEPVVE